MKKADNFDASKWLVENKITTQSRLNELLNYDKVEQLSKKAIEDYISSNNLGTISSIGSLGMALSHDKAIAHSKVIFDSGKTINISAQYDANYNLTDIKINTSINTSKSINSDEEEIEIEYPSGDYTGYIEDGEVQFLLIDDSIEDKYEEGFDVLDDTQIMKYLGKNHFFTKLYNTIGGIFSTESNTVGITVDLNDLKSKFGRYIK
jgi:hypothetical protein